MRAAPILRDPESSDVVFDLYHGIEVADPFRWLEEHQSLRTRAWIDEQASDSHNYLHALPGRDTIKPRIAELIDQETLGDVRRVGDTIFYIKRKPGEEQAKLYKRDGIKGEDTLLLDPNDLGEGSSLSISIIDIAPNGKLLAYGVRSGGSDARRVCILDVETMKALPDELPMAFVRGFNFLPKSDGYFYVIEELGNRSAPKAAKCHFIGQPFDQDNTLFSLDRASNVRLVASFDASSCAAVHTVIRTDGDKNLISIYLQMVRSNGHPLKCLVEDSPEPCDACIHKGQLFLLLNRHADVGRKLLRVPLNDPDLARAEIVFAEGPGRFQTWRVFGDRILTITVEDLTSVLRMYTLAGEVVGILDLPEAGTVSILGGDLNGFFFSFESYTHPRGVYYHDFASGDSTLFGTPAKELAHLCVRRVHYTAEDGALIPLTLLGRREVLERGLAPVLLTAYGSGGISLTPQHSFLATCFVELGGIFATAHIRGGGEHGVAWAEAGKRLNRPTVHKDFLSAAEYLVSSGTAAHDRIAIAGGSNSGLLVCTALTQRPELFRAVVCLAPITDMLRYHHFQNTQFYVPQFGSAEDVDDFPVLLSYSPYHNVSDGARYPALLMISGDADTRCDPMHARKFVARLQAAMSSLPADVKRDCPILLDWNPLRGHCPVLPLSTRTAAIVDRLAFLCHHLKMEIV